MKIVEPLPLSLDVSPKRQTVSPGSLVTLDLIATRREPFTEVVTVTGITTYPSMGNPGPSVTIPKAKTGGTFAFRLPLALNPGIYHVVLQGAGNSPFSKDTKAKTKPNIGLSVPSNPVTVVVRAVPLAIVLKPALATVKAGAKTEVHVTASRRDGGKDPIELRLIAPAALKLKADDVRGEPGKALKLVVTSAPDTPPGLTIGVAVQATVLVNGEPVDINEPLTLTIIK